MKITVESTTQIVRIVVNGVEVPARIWEGVTETGLPVHCFVTRIAADKNADLTQFERELQECRVPSSAVADAYGIDARLIL